MGILGPLPKIKSGNDFIVLKMNRYSKLKKALQTAQRTLTAVARILADLYTSNLGIQSSILTDDSPQRASEFVKGICAELRITTPTNTEYSSQKMAR